MGWKIFIANDFNKRLIVFISILLVVNMITVFFYDLMISKIFRLASTISVLVYLFAYKFNHRLIYAVLLIIMVSDIAIVGYEYNWGVLLYGITATLSYLLLALNVVRNIEWTQINWYEYLIYAFVLVFNYYTFNFLSNNISSDFDSDIIFYSLKVSGIMGIIMCLISGLYNATRLSFKTAYFMYATFGLVFSDFSAMLAYYYKMEPFLFYFLDRAMYIFAFYCLIKYVYYYTEEQKLIVVKAKRSFQDSKVL